MKRGSEETYYVSGMIPEYQHLFLEWTDPVNKSGLIRDAIKQEMRYRDIDIEDAEEAVNEALEEGLDVDTLEEEFNSFSQLEEAIHG